MHLCVFFIAPCPRFTDAVEEGAAFEPVDFGAEGGEGGDGVEGGLEVEEELLEGEVFCEEFVFELCEEEGVGFEEEVLEGGGEGLGDDAVVVPTLGVDEAADGEALLAEGEEFGDHAGEGGVEGGAFGLREGKMEGVLLLLGR